MSLRSLFILPTNYCTLNCAHCAIHDITKPRCDLNMDTVEKLIQNASTHQFNMLVISGGGEPLTVDESILIRILQASNKENIYSRVVTNAYWATSFEETMRRLRPLVENGLRQVVVSVSEGHQKYVKYDHILNVAKATNALNLNCYLYLTTLNVKTDPLQEIVHFFAKRNEPLPYIQTANYFIPFGNAADNFDKSDFQLIDDNKLRGACPSVGNNICVHPSGTVTCCAMVFALNVKALHIGDIYRDSLAHIMQRSETNRLMQWLATYGIVALKEKVEKHTDLRFSDKHVNMCHLCCEMLLHPRVLHFLKQANIIHEQSCKI